MSVDLLPASVVDRVWNPRVACVVTLGIVFLCGALAGALVMDLGLHNRRSTPDTTAYTQRLQKELGLTPVQAEQIDVILKDFWQYYVTVMSDSKQRIEQVLTPEQRSQFERFLQDQKK